MGDIADMMIEGTLCAGCGVYLGEGDAGYPIYCKDCRKTGFNDEAIAQRNTVRKLEKIKCPHCQRKCGGQQGLKAHIKTKHAELLTKQFSSKELA